LVTEISKIYGEPYGRDVAELKLGLPLASKVTKLTVVSLCCAITLFTDSALEVLAANVPSPP
jgi:hypothetical protein